MKQTRTTRRGFLGSTAALGAMGLVSGWSTAAFAQAGGTLRLRIDGDNNVLDPGFMSGGTEWVAHDLTHIAQIASHRTMATGSAKTKPAPNVPMRFMLHLRVRCRA